MTGRIRRELTIIGIQLALQIPYSKPGKVLYCSVQIMMGLLSLRMLFLLAA